MRNLILIILGMFILTACTPQTTTTTPKPTQAPKENTCADLHIDLFACLEGTTVKYTIDGNIPFSHQFVGLGSSHIQDMFPEESTHHEKQISAPERLNRISINPHVNGVLCQDKTEMYDLKDC